MGLPWAAASEEESDDEKDQRALNSNSQVQYDKWVSELCSLMESEDMSVKHVALRSLLIIARRGDPTVSRYVTTCLYSAPNVPLDSASRDESTDEEGAHTSEDD